MRRRQGLRIVAFLLIALAAPTVAASPPLLGVLLLGNPTSDSPLQIGLSGLGHVAGKTLRVEWRFAHGDNARFPTLARELLSLKPDVIFAPCGPAQRAVRDLDRRVPIVAFCADEKNFLGEVASFRRPGGATTGITFLAPESASKRLEILKEIHPDSKRVAFLYHSGDDWDNYWREIERVAPKLSFAVVRLPIKGPGDLEEAFAAALRERIDALVAFPDATTFGARERIAAFALKHRLATAFDLAPFADAGGLFSYGADLDYLMRQVAPRYIDRILKGEKPGDLPVEQPTKFELVINLKTAKALGLAIPANLLLRTDRVIK